MGNGQPNNTAPPFMCLKCGKNNHTKTEPARNAMFSALTARVRSMHPVVVHTSQELCLQQMVRHQTTVSSSGVKPLNKVTNFTSQAEKRRSLRTKIDRSRNNNNRMWVCHPLKNSILIHHPHLVATCTHLHHQSSRPPQHNQIIV